MKIVILNGSESPIYEQIFRQISTQILEGTLAPNESLPSIRKVAREIGTSIITVKKAWELLEQNGMIYTQAGKGCFVCEDALDNKLKISISIAKEQLRKDLPFYKRLRLSIEDLVLAVIQTYDQC